MTNTQHTYMIDILTADHHEVLDLIATVIETPDPGLRRDTIDTVIAEIVRHSVAEETYVYPTMREHLTDGDAEVRHDIEEHQQLEETMKALERTDADDIDSPT